VCTLIREVDWRQHYDAWMLLYTSVLADIGFWWM